MDENRVHFIEILKLNRISTDNNGTIYLLFWHLNRNKITSVDEELCSHILCVRCGILNGIGIGMQLTVRLDRGCWILHPFVFGFPCIVWAFVVQYIAIVQQWMFDDVNNTSIADDDFSFWDPQISLVNIVRMKSIWILINGIWWIFN